jgi:lysozyme
MRLENNLGGDNLYGNFRLYIEGVEVPFSSASITNTYRGLPTAQVVLAPWRGFSEITKGYFPKVHIFYRDFNQGLAPYDMKKMAGMATSNPLQSQQIVGEATETYNLMERHAYKLIFGGVITSVTDSKSLAGEGGSASVVLSCVHPYYILNEILFKYIGTNPHETTAKDSAFGIMVDGGNIGSLATIKRALAGVRVREEGQLTLEDGGGDISILSDTMADNYWRLQGLPGVIVALWNCFKHSAYSTDSQTDKSIMTRMYIPLMESGIRYFTKMSGHPMIEGAVQNESKTPPEQAPTSTQTADDGKKPEPTTGITKMSDRGKKELIEASEGRFYRLYDDATGKTIARSRDATGEATIGVGHHVSKTDSQYDNKTISDATVDALLSADIASAEQAVAKLGLKLTQGQFDAAVDLTFNVGPGGRGLKDGALWQITGDPSTFIRLIRDGNPNGAANELMSWVYHNGNVSPGLVSRRKRDQAFFLDQPVPTAQQEAANQRASKGTDEETASGNGKIIPGNMNGLMPKAIADQLLLILANEMTSGGTGEVMSFGQLIDAFLDIVEYDHVILTSPAKIGVLGKPELIDHIYKPRMFAYYSPICNVLLPYMYEGYSINLGTDQVPSRVVYNGMQFTTMSAANFGTTVNSHNYVAPHSVRVALADSGNLSKSLESTVAAPGKYEWGTGVRTADGQLPYWYAVLSHQAVSGNIGNLANDTTLERLKAAWNKLYPEDPTLNMWDAQLSGIEDYQRLFFTGVDVEFSNTYSKVRQGSVEGVFNPFIVPGYPMDIIDPSPLRESYHGFCTSVTHTIDASGYAATSIGMSSAYTFSEIATCYIPGTYPWLLAQLKMDENLSMYGNTEAFQSACQYYNDVLGVGAADPTILEAYSTGDPIPVKRNLGVWEIGEAQTMAGSSHPTLYTTTLGNLNLVARNIASLLDIEVEHRSESEAQTFVDIDMWNQGSPTVEQVRKGPWVNDQSGTHASTLRGRDMERSAFLDYEDGEVPDPIIKKGARPTNVPPQTGETLPLQEATVQGEKAKVLPKLGKRCSVGSLDAESLAKLADCHPDLVKVVMKVIETRPVIVTSGHRSQEQQEALNRKVGAGSRHRKYPSWAIDMVPCNNLTASSRAVMQNFANYVLECANSVGVTLRWGGDFSDYDPVHFDLGLG